MPEVENRVEKKGKLKPERKKLRNVVNRTEQSKIDKRKKGEPVMD